MCKEDEVRGRQGVRCILFPSLPLSHTLSIHLAQSHLTLTPWFRAPVAAGAEEEEGGEVEEREKDE
jgi:hypothetical protein